MTFAAATLGPYEIVTPLGTGGSAAARGGADLYLELWRDLAAARSARTAC
jgi:hypothetical protein